MGDSFERQPRDTISEDDGVDDSFEESRATSNGGVKRPMSSDETDPEWAVKKIKQEKDVTPDEEDFEELVDDAISQRISAEASEHLALVNNCVSESAAGLHSSENAAQDIPDDVEDADPGEIDEYLYGTDEAGDRVFQAFDYPTPEDTLESQELPTTLEHLMNNLFEWDPAEVKKGSPLKLENKQKDIAQIYTFPSPAVYKVVFIPTIVSQMQFDIAAALQRKENVLATCSIMLKCKDQNSKILDLKCITMRKASQKPLITFGQLISIRCVVPNKKDNPELTVSNKAYFGYVNTQRTRHVDERNQCDVNHRLTLPESDRSRCIVDEFIIRMKYTNDIYCRNDLLIIAEGLKEIHHYILQAKAVYAIEAFAVGKELLSPTYTVRPSGIPIDVEISKFRPVQLDAIQKSVDLACNANQPCSFVCLQTTERAQGVAVMRETVKQLVKIMDAQGIKRKILVVGPNHANLSKILTKDPSHNIFYINSGLLDKRIEKETQRLCVDVRKQLLQQLQNKPDERLKKRVKILEECIRFSQSEVHEAHMSVKSVLERRSHMEHAKRKLMEECNVMAGRLEDLCNDVAFYLSFNVRGPAASKIMCCLIDGAESLSEATMASLYCFGVQKFVLCGDINKDNPADENGNSLKKKGLTRSLFSRLYRYSSKVGSDPHYASVINLDVS